LSFKDKDENFSSEDKDLQIGPRGQGLSSRTPWVPLGSGVGFGPV